jgi:Heterokaryon incompatibility protein (HET)
VVTVPTGKTSTEDVSFFFSWIPILGGATYRTSKSLSVAVQVSKATNRGSGCPLASGGLDAPISGTLFPIQLGELHQAPQQPDDALVLHKYKTLSCIWSDSCKCEIFLAREPSHITPNLASLKQLMFPHRARILWIDAICVNQNDLDERIHQASSMRHKYMLASRAIVWLGDASNRSTTRLRQLRNLVTATSPEAKRATAKFIFGPDSNLGIRDVFTQPWQDSVWVLT